MLFRSPDQPLQPGDLGKVADAITATEKGIGSRVNNPGNIRDGAFARAQPGYQGSLKGYAKFANPIAGRAAMLTLLGKKFSAGQRTMRDMIEGAPAGPQTHPAYATIRKDAEDAIAAGADPEKVKARAASMGVKL